MSLFAVRGRFANNFTFSVNPVDASDAKEALTAVTGAEEIRKYASDNDTEINMISVKKLSGSKRKVHISEKAAAERKGGRKKKAAPAATDAPETTEPVPETPAPTQAAATKPAQPTASKSRR